jgi:hypothetical protein
VRETKQAAVVTCETNEYNAWFRSQPSLPDKEARLNKLDAVQQECRAAYHFTDADAALYRAPPSPVVTQSGNGHAVTTLSTAALPNAQLPIISADASKLQAQATAPTQPTTLTSPDPDAVVQRIQQCKTTGADVDRLLNRPGSARTRGKRYLIGPVPSKTSPQHWLIVYVNRDDTVVDVYWDNLSMRPYTPHDQCSSSTEQDHAAREDRPRDATSLASGSSQGTRPVPAAPDAVCVAASQLTRAMTPSDLYGILRACINSADYESANAAFGLAGVYGRFDMLRVADATAHQAVGILKEWALTTSDPEKSATFKKQALVLYDDEARRTALCQKLMAVGPPAYYPGYMTAHGLSAINGTEATSDGLVAGFDAADAWKKALGYVNCK